MAHKDIYQFGDKKWLDGSIPVLKNGVMTVCPEAHTFAIEEGMAGRPVLKFPPCRTSCPRLHKVERILPAKDGKPEERTPGYILACEAVPQFIEIAPASISKLLN